MDECEFKVSVLGQHRLEKNRLPGFVLEPNCAEIIHYNIAGEKLKAVIEQTNINHVHITTSSRISIFLSQWVQSPFRHWNLHSINFLNHVCSYEIRWKSVTLIFILSQWVQNTFGHWNLQFSNFLITYVGKRFFGTNVRNKCYFLCKSVTLHLAVEISKAAIEQTSVNITTSARILIFLSQWVQNTFGHWNLHFSSFLITYVGKRFVATNARKIEGHHRTDGYKHHNLGTNFDIFIAVSWKSLRSLKSTLYISFQITYIAKRFVGTDAIENKSFSCKSVTGIIISWKPRLNRRVYYKTSQPRDEFYRLKWVQNLFGHS